MEPLFLKIFNKTFEIKPNERSLEKYDEIVFYIELGLFNCYCSRHIRDNSWYIYTGLSQDGVDEETVALNQIEQHIEQLVINHFKAFSSARFTIEEVVEKAILNKNNVIKEIIE